MTIRAPAHKLCAACGKAVEQHSDAITEGVGYDRSIFHVDCYKRHRRAQSKEKRKQLRIVNRKPGNQRAFVKCPSCGAKTNVSLGARIFSARKCISPAGHWSVPRDGKWLPVTLHEAQFYNKVILSVPRSDSLVNCCGLGIVATDYSSHFFDCHVQATMGSAPAGIEPPQPEATIPAPHLHEVPPQLKEHTTAIFALADATLDDIIVELAVRFRDWLAKVERR